MATAQANAAAPLDQLLVDVGVGPLRRWLPGRPGVEFIASVAGKPRKVSRRLSIMVGELDRVALAWRSDQQIRFLAGGSAGRRARHLCLRDPAPPNRSRPALSARSGFS